jgi:hypothetical protein
MTNYSITVFHGMYLLVTILLELNELITKHVSLK